MSKLKNLISIGNEFSNGRELMINTFEFYDNVFKFERPKTIFQLGFLFLGYRQHLLVL